MKTYLEYKDEKSQKFWEITLKGKEFTTRYGKIGANGTSKSKILKTEEVAKKEYEKLVKQKIKKGYASENTKNVINNGKIFTIWEKDFIKYLHSITKVDLSPWHNSKTIYYKGNVKFDNLDLFSIFFKNHKIEAIIIDGDLEVSETIYTYDDPQTLLIVNGNVKAKNIITSGHFFVTKNVLVSYFLLGDYNKGAMKVLGNTKANIFYPEVYSFSLNSRNFEISFDDYFYMFNTKITKFKDMLELLHPEFLKILNQDYINYFDEIERSYEIWDWLDSSKLTKYIKSCKPILRNELNIIKTYFNLLKNKQFEQIKNIKEITINLDKLIDILWKKSKDHNLDYLIYIEDNNNEQDYKNKLDWLKYINIKIFIEGISAEDKIFKTCIFYENEDIDYCFSFIATKNKLELKM